MSQAVITKVFAEWKAQQAVDSQAVTLDEFIFAYIPGLDTDAPIDNTETTPAVDKIVHRQAVSKTGIVNENSVVYSVTLGADVGDFDFNWIGLTNKSTGTLAMIIHAPTQRKIKNADGQQGNVLVRSMLMEYSGAREATEISTPAETWQIDFTARLSSMDGRHRRENIDLYGAAAFFDDGYLVAKTGSQYFVTKGAGYVAGLRSALPANQPIAVTAGPVKAWLDVCWTGTLTSEWGVQSQITLAQNLADYVQSGVQHYVFAIASIDAAGVITDLRPRGTLNDQAASDALRKHELSRNHPDATTGAKGFVQLSSDTNSDSEALAATPRAVKVAMDNAQAAMDNANSRLAMNKNGADIQDKERFIENIGAVSGQGGSYNSDFSFKGMSTIATEMNVVKMYSAARDVTQITGGTVCGVNMRWYNDTYDIGITRSSGTAINGFQITYNGQVQFSIEAANSTVRVAGHIYAGGGLFESGGSVRVYSPNNPQPMTGYATTDWVVQNFVMSVDLTAPFEQEFWDGRGYMRATDGAAMYNIKFVGGGNNVGAFMLRYTRKLINNIWYVLA